MTEQEKREWVIEGLEFTLEESGWDANAAYDQELMIQVVTEAIALLKAQEPKLVHFTATINYRKIGKCPNCSKPINSGDYPRYCGNCGQAVKWE